MERRNQQRIRHGVTSYTFVMADVRYHEALINCVWPFMERTGWILNFEHRFKKTMSTIVTLQEKFRIISFRNNLRMGFLEEYWKNEIEIFCLELRASKKEEENRIAEKYFGIWYEKIDIKKLVCKLLHLLMDRCKLKHSMNYFQERGYTIGLNPSIQKDLMGMFNDRKRYLMKV
jgi:hypothetical protein